MEQFRYESGQLLCEGMAVDALAAEYGTPLYIYSKAALLGRFESIRKAFAEAAPVIAFSVKSCSNIGILKILQEAGSGFDIVSGGELARVLRAGGDPRKVVFAGVAKSDDEIRDALDNDILMLNVESEAELDNIQNIAAEMGTVAPVALRLNPDVDARTNAKTTTGKKENKFGIDLMMASRIIKNIALSPNIRLLGVDIHLGSPVNSTGPYTEALNKLADFIRDHRSPRSQLEYLDIGGGFGLLYRDETVPSFQEYADAVLPFVKKTGCKLILEPGRSIAGNSAILVSQVRYLKDNGTKHFTIIDAGMNDLIRPAMYDSYHFIWPTKSNRTPPSHLFGAADAPEYIAREAADAAGGGGREMQPDGLILTDVVGPICESSDAFAKGRRLPLVNRGQNLAIFSAGAYGFAMSSQYNSRPRPAEVLVDGDTVKVLRRRETVEDLMLGEEL